VNLWRLEWLRLIRTPRALSLGAVFLVIGLIEPAVTKYESQIFRHVGNGVKISAPPPTPADGLNGYVSQVTLVGLVLVVVLAAGAFSFDASPGLATFLRTRVSSTWQLITPRFTAYAAAAAVAYLIGTVAAWYETAQLIGSLPAAGVLGGVLCATVYLAFAVAVTALTASMMRGTIATAGLAFVVLLALPIAGTIRSVAQWLPSALVSAPVSLVDGAHRLPYYLPVIGVTIAATAAALALAAFELGRREI
jgi:ABC-2 type transport system permease protein